MKRLFIVPSKVSELIVMQEFHGEEVGDYLNDLIGLLCRNYLPQAEQCQAF
jgi:hypothetical protein